ncbi:uncharacterized protein TNCV_394611 [Trichonephila clavipes]|nr:uncharacterized protein TNCV_394611 [Trichonephila clavipes]
MELKEFRGQYYVGLSKCSDSSNEVIRNRFNIPLAQLEQLLNNKSPIWPGIVIHKNEVWANDPSEQTHMGKKYLLTIAIPNYKPSVENVELSPPIQHNASPDKDSRTSVTVSFLDVNGIKLGLDRSPNQNALRIASGTEPTVIRKEDTTSLISCPVFILCTNVNGGVGGQLSTGGSVQDGGRIGPHF